MATNPTWRRYLRFWRAEPERDVDDELRTHFDLRVADLTARGLSEAEARRQALEEFGDVDSTRERLYEIGRRRSRRHEQYLWFDALRADLRQARRYLSRNPLSTGIVVLTLALGVGAIATTYGIMRQLIVQPPPHVVDPDRVVRFFFVWQYPDNPYSPGPQSGYAAYEAAREQRDVFSSVAAYTPDQEIPVGDGVDARLTRATLVSAGFWHTLGVRPRLGRFIAEDEADPVTGARVVVLGHAFWQRRMGGAPDVVGRELEVRGMPYTIIGVAPRGFRGMEITDTDIWLPLRAYSDGAPTTTLPRDLYVHVVARLNTGVSMSAAEVRASNRFVTAMKAESPSQFDRPDYQPRLAVELAPAHGALGYGMRLLPEARLSAWLVGVAAILLGVACTNVSGLLLLRALRRRHELALRLALGMSRRRLAGLLLTEGAVVATLGGLAAALVVMLAGPWVRRILLDGMLAEPAHTDWAVVGLSASCTLGAAVLAGFAPLLQFRDPALTALGDGGNRSTTRRSLVFRTLLVTQTALSVVLLIGAGLFVRSMQRIAALDHGMDVEHVLTLEADFTGTGRTEGERAAFYERALQRLRGIPGVQHASLARYVPLRGPQGGGVFRIAGSPGVVQQPDRRAPRQNDVAGDFFAATGMRVLEGRDFTTADRTGAGVMAVNERLARHVWPGRSPVGECAYFTAAPNECVRVVAVVSDARMLDLREELRFWFYRPLPAGDSTAERTLFVRVATALPGLLTTLRRAMHELDPAVPYVDIRRLGEPLEPQIRPWRIGVTVLTAFGVLAMLLAAIGLYAAVGYAVSQRTREIGVRVAIGATRRQILGLVVSDGLRVTITGIAIGLAIGVSVAPLIAGLLFDVSPRDPVVLLSVAASLVVMAVVASLEPARRAASVDPVSALRAE